MISIHIHKYHSCSTTYYLFSPLPTVHECLLGHLDDILDILRYSNRITGARISINMDMPA